MGNNLRMDKKQLLRSMLEAGWAVRRIRCATRIHPTVVAKYRREWATPQSDPEVSADPGTPPAPALTLSGSQSDPQVSAGSGADPLRAPTHSEQLTKLVDVVAQL